jgi:hypothetical protein
MITVKLSNFKLSNFRNFLEQSLMVNNQLMLEFTPEMVQSCSFSQTQSFIKLWTTPLKNLLVDIEQLELELTPIVKEIPNFPAFDFYVLKGDLFKKYLSVHTADTVDFEFILHEKGKTYQAANITITSVNGNSVLKTSFTLTTEELISNKIEDYSLIIKECTPDTDMVEFMLTDDQIREIRRLIKNLHKSSPTNTAFLTFSVDAVNQKITVNDSVFSIDFQLALPIKSENFSFNILKSDFVMGGNHNFTIYTNGKSPKVILGAKYSSIIVWCLSSKVTENSMAFDETADSIMDSAIDSLNIEDYF